MRTGRPKQPLTLDIADQTKLELLARRPKTAQRVALRAKIVLGASRPRPRTGAHARWHKKSD